MPVLAKFSAYNNCISQNRLMIPRRNGWDTIIPPILVKKLFIYPLTPSWNLLGHRLEIHLYFSSPHIIPEVCLTLLFPLISFYKLEINSLFLDHIQRSGLKPLGLAAKKTLFKKSRSLLWCNYNSSWMVPLLCEGQTGVKIYFKLHFIVFLFLSNLEQQRETNMRIRYTFSSF